MRGSTENGYFLFCDTGNATFWNAAANTSFTYLAAAEKLLTVTEPNPVPNFVQGLNIDSVDRTYTISNRGSDQLFISYKGFAGVWIYEPPTTMVNTVIRRIQVYYDDAYPSANMTITGRIVRQDVTTPGGFRVNGASYTGNTDTVLSQCYPRVLSAGVGSTKTAIPGPAGTAHNLV